MSVPKNESVAKNRQNRYARWTAGYPYGGSDPLRQGESKNKTKATNRMKPRKRK